MEFRLITVTTGTNQQQARILITGSMLDCLGFLPETLVTVFSRDGVLTMKAQGTGLDIYQQLVTDVRKQKGQMLQVFNWTRKKTETHLVLEGHWLEKQGFFVGDVLLAHFQQGLITMKRFLPWELGFSSHFNASYRHLIVQKNNQAPLISLNAEWLTEFGFQIGETARLSYDSGLLTVRPCKAEQTKKWYAGMSAQIKVMCKRRVPYLRIAGGWLSMFGYCPGDLLILQCQKDQLQIKRLTNHHLCF